MSQNIQKFAEYLERVFKVIFEGWEVTLEMSDLSFNFVFKQGDFLRISNYYDLFLKPLDLGGYIGNTVTDVMIAYERYIQDERQTNI